MNQTALLALQTAFVQCQDMDAPLDERLDAYSRAVQSHIPDYADAVEKLVARLKANNAGDDAPRVGDLMPSFMLPDENGLLVSLEGVLESGPAAITFHRGHWCPWCRISLNALARVNDTISLLGGHVVAIVPERQKFTAEMKHRAKAPFPILTDLDNGYALSLNLAVWIGPDLERLLASYGLALPNYQGNASWMLPIPATFVIAQDGRVKARFIDPDFRRRMAIDRLLEALRAAR